MNRNHKAHNIQMTKLIIIMEHKVKNSIQITSQTLIVKLAQGKVSQKSNPKLIKSKNSACKSIKWS